MAFCRSPLRFAFTLLVLPAIICGAETAELATRISKLARAGVSKRISAEPPTGSKLDQFLLRNPASFEIVRNPDCWAADLDLSPIAAAFQGQGAWGTDFSATLITSRHVVMAAHAALGPGTQLLFCTKANRLLDRKVVDLVRIEGSDIAVGLLDADIPAEQIEPATLAPAEWFLASPAAGVRDISVAWAGVPVLCSNRDRKATLEVIQGLGKRLLLVSPKAGFEMNSSEADVWQHYFQPPVVGTSGSPIFLIVDGNVSLLGHYTTAHPDTGPCYAFWLDELRRAVRSLGPPRSLSVTPLPVRAK